MKRKSAISWLFLLGLPAVAIELPHSAPVAPPPPAAGGGAEREARNPGAVEERVNAAKPGEDPVAEEKAEAYLGVGGSKIPDLLSRHLQLEEGMGIVIRTLDPDGPAAKAGLAEDDVIIRVSGQSVGNQEELRDIVQEHRPGDEIEVEYIHRGETKTVKLALAEDRRAGTAVARGHAQPLDHLMLEGMPQDQARRIREEVERNLRAFERAQLHDQDTLREMAEGQARRIREEVERNLRAFENLDQFGFPADDPAFDMAREMQDRMNRMFGRGHGFDISAFGGAGGANIRSSSTIRMMDENGSIELRSEDGEKQVRAYDRNGKLQWKGPLDDEDHPMPEDIRERVDRLNIDMDFKGNGLRLRMRQR